MLVKVAVGLCVGLPCVGKSSWGRKLLGCLNVLEECLDSVDSVDVVHVEYDVEMGTLQFGEELQWKTMRLQLRMKVEECIERFLADEENANRFLVVLVDDNMFFKSMRRVFYSLCLKLQSAFFQLVVPYPIEELDYLINQDANRENSVGADTIIRMADKIEYPDTSCRWESNSIILPHVHSSFEDTTVLNNVVQCILQAVESAKVAIKESLHVEVDKQTQTAKHKVDLIVRKIVGESMNYLRTAGASKDVMKNAGNSFSIYKKEFCSKISKHIISEDDIIIYEQQCRSDCSAMISSLQQVKT